MVVAIVRVVAGNALRVGVFLTCDARRRRRQVVMLLVIAGGFRGVAGMRVGFVSHIRQTERQACPYTFFDRRVWRASHAHTRHCSRLQAPQKISSFSRSA